jgi:hypothetical protein
MKSMLALTAAVAALLAALPAAAQKPDECAGTLEVIRFSQLKPGKTIADFQKVVDQHMAWYRKHGYTQNRQIVAPVVTVSGVNPNEIVTIHVNAPGLKRDEHDAEWENFVDAYRAVSTVEAMHTVCLPKQANALLAACDNLVHRADTETTSRGRLPPT